MMVQTKGQKRKKHTPPTIDEAASSSPPSRLRKKPARSNRELQSSAHCAGVAAGDFFPARSILEERRAPDGAVEYLVDWEDDPATSKSFDPTWEPKANVNSELEAEWLQKQQRLGKEPQPLPSHETEASVRSYARARKARGVRALQVINSSSGEDLTQISPSKTQKSSHASPTVRASRENSDGFLAAPEGSQYRNIQEQATLGDSQRTTIHSSTSSTPKGYKTISQESLPLAAVSVFGPGAQPGASLPPTQYVEKSNRFAIVTEIADSQSEPSNQGRVDSGLDQLGADQEKPSPIIDRAAAESKFADPFEYIPTTPSKSIKKEIPSNYSFEVLSTGPVSPFIKEHQERTASAVSSPAQTSLEEFHTPPPINPPTFEAEAPEEESNQPQSNKIEGSTGNRETPASLLDFNPFSNSQEASNQFEDSQEVHAGDSELALEESGSGADKRENASLASSLDPSLSSGDRKKTVRISESEPQSSSLPLPPSSDNLLLESQLHLSDSKMPETRRSLKGLGPSSSAQGSDENDSPVRKSLRGMRNEAAAKRAEAKARALKLHADFEHSTGLGDVKQPPRRSESLGESETGSSTAAAVAAAAGGGRGRSRKSRNIKHDTDGTPGLPIQSDLRADEENGKATNGNETTSPQAAVIEEEEEDEADAEFGLHPAQMEFTVLLPMAGPAADQYRRTVNSHRKLIMDFVPLKSPSPELVDEAKSFIQKMRDITTHIDLVNISAMTQGEVEPWQQAEWDRTCSVKFNFLYKLLKHLRDQDIHLVIISKPDRLIDMLETFLSGAGINFYRPDNQHMSKEGDASGSLSITLLPSHGEGSKDVSRSTRAIISMDHDLDVNSPHIRTLRLRSMDTLAPIIYLAVINSVDHIERSFVPSWTGVDKLRAELRCIGKLRHCAGKMDQSFQTIEESAMLTAEFLAYEGSNEEDWPVAPIGPLDDNEAWDLTRGEFSLLGSLHSSEESSLSGQKRPRDEMMMDIDETSNKKARVNSQTDNDASIATGSDSNSSRQNRMMTEEADSLRSDLKAAEERLQSSLLERDLRLRDFENALNELQFRFEEQTAEKRTLFRQLEEAQRKLETEEKLRERKENTITMLREENTDLRNQLVESRSALENSSVPEIAELERLRKENQEAKRAREKAERELANEHDLGNYLRQNYNTASTRAKELEVENEKFQATVENLEKKASGEAARLRGLHLDAQTQLTKRENERLKHELKSRNQLLQRKEEELTKRRVGIGTRAGSVPRSPRVGPSSRAGSPIPDRRVETLKNNFQGRRHPKPVPVEEPLPTSNSAHGSTNIQVEVKQVEPKMAELKPVEPRLPDIQPAQPKPVIEVKNGPSTARPFPCCFAQYNCHASFTSKNEWKRHISTKHIQLGFWRCDMCNPSAGLDHPVFNDFNRKDLFTQHLRRMHSGPVPPPNQGKDGNPSQQSSQQSGLSDEAIAEIQKRCYRALRNPPHHSSCVFCTRPFQGPNSWEERLEHVGGHLERDRKNGTNCSDISSWREDPPLREYLLLEGIVEADTQRGGFRIGDGRPRRTMDMQSPTPTGSAGSSQMPIMVDADSEGSISKRRRGRPPKRYSDVDSPLRLAANIQRPDVGEMRPRPEQAQPQPIRQPPHDMREAVPPGRAHALQPRTPPGAMSQDIRDGVSTRSQGQHPPRIEAYPPNGPPQQLVHDNRDGVSTRSQNILPRPLMPLQQHGHPHQFPPPESRDGVATRSVSAGHMQPIFHQAPGPSPVSATGGDSDDGRKAARGRTFREVIM